MNGVGHSIGKEIGTDSGIRDEAMDQPITPDSGSALTRVDRRGYWDILRAAFIGIRADLKLLYASFHIEDLPSLQLPIR